ncbi:MAG: Wzz/FepE/Etk N-terminal domain-containing protein, partial [Acidimicrobiia bacterium]|nr:Wzz/FepE/Etk N-terminal domain-containing protein [Acidimicrobiia bacterium]
MDPISPFEPTVLGAAWRFRWLVLAVVVVFGGLGYLYAIQASEDEEWVAVASLVVEDPNASTLFEAGGLQRPERYLENQVEILSSDIVAQRASELAAQSDPPVTLDFVDIVDNTSIGSSSSSDVLEIRFRSDGEFATLVGANALADAYQDVRRSEASRNFSASIAQLDDSIVESEAELSDLQDQIAQLLSSDAGRQELQGQFGEVIAQLVDLQSRRGQAGPEALEDIRLELDDLLQQLETLQVVESVERQQPELTALNAKQGATIERISSLTDRRDQLEVDSELAGSGVVLFSPAFEAELQASSVARIVAVALVLGLLAGAGLGYFLALRRRNFSDRTEPELVVAAPMLAEVPNFKEERIETALPVRDAPFSAAAEAFRFVATAVAQRLGSDPEEAQR